MQTHLLSNFVLIVKGRCRCFFGKQGKARQNIKAFACSHTAIGNPLGWSLICSSSIIITVFGPICFTHFHSFGGERCVTRITSACTFGNGTLEPFRLKDPDRRRSLERGFPRSTPFGCYSSPTTSCHGHERSTIILGCGGIKVFP